MSADTWNSILFDRLIALAWFNTLTLFPASLFLSFITSGSLLRLLPLSHLSPLFLLQDYYPIARVINWSCECAKNHVLPLVWPLRGSKVVHVFNLMSLEWGIDVLVIGFSHICCCAGDISVPCESLQGCSNDIEGGWTDDLQCLFLISTLCSRGDKVKTKWLRVLHYSFRAGAFIRHFETLQSQFSNSKTTCLTHTLQPFIIIGFQLGGSRNVPPAPQNVAHQQPL